MGKPVTLLEGLCGHALSFGAQAFQVDRKDRREWVFLLKGGACIGHDRRSFQSGCRRNCARIFTLPRSPCGLPSTARSGFSGFASATASARTPTQVADRSSPEARSVRGSPFHEETGSVSGLHLQLHKDPSPGSGGSGFNALSGHSPIGSPGDDPESRTQPVSSKKDTWAGAIHSPPDALSTCRAWSDAASLQSALR